MARRSRWIWATGLSDAGSDKEKLLDDIERRLTADIRREPLFTLRWRLV